MQAYNDYLDRYEASLGYTIEEIDNPQKDPGAPERIRAVVYVLGLSDRVIKISSMLTGKPTYTHKRYGVWQNLQEEPAEWHPVGHTCHDPRQAIELAMNHYDEDFICKVVPRVPQ